MKLLIICLVAVSMVGMDTTPKVDDKTSLTIEKDINDALQLIKSWNATLLINPTPTQSIEISIPFEQAIHTLKLEPYSIRADGYTVLMQDETGALYEVQAGPIRTLRGSIVELEESTVAGSLMPDGLHARIRLANGQEYWMEPVGSKITKAPLNLYAFYRTQDIVPHDGKCGVVQLKQNALSFGSQSQHEQLRSIGNELCTAQLGVDTDYEYYQDWGSDTEARINQIINSVNLQYESEVDLTHEITTIIVRSDPNDPYTATDAEELLYEFGYEWFFNQGGITRDTAHLFTGRELDNSTIGIAVLGAICDSIYGVGLSQSDFNGNFSCATDLTAHELGHNWNAEHCNCPQHTMNPYITCANQFSQSSIDSITTFAGSLSCTTCETNACDGDVDENGAVDVTDLLAVVDQWGNSGGSADVNNDGVIDVSDLLLIVGNWGPCE